MIPHSERVQCVAWINAEVASGARKGKAWDVVGMTIRTLQNWQVNGGISADKRPDAVRPAPSNKLTPKERDAILTVCNAAEGSQSSPQSDCANSSG